MNKAKRLLCATILFMPLMMHAQAEGKGIQWTTGLSWEQVKQKAKQENKYIFLDCYATWCSPCKAMDSSVYVSDSVGALFNEKFIAVKVQMDKTAKDDESTKKWYDDAQAINKTYHVEGYPSFIFFTPQGDRVQQDAGYKGVKELMDLAEAALHPGKVYNDPYKEYRQLVAAYKQGKRDYDRYPLMIRTSCGLKEFDLGQQLINELSEYLSVLPSEKRYTKEILELWSHFPIASTSRVFGFFYTDGKWIDKVMSQKGYAKKVVDRTIYDEMVIPFFTEQAKSSTIQMTGMILTGPGQQPDYGEADWSKLYKKIKEKYNNNYARRVLLQAKIEWYDRHRNWPVAVMLHLYQFKKYPPDFAQWSTIANTNQFAWKAFLNITDKKVLKETSTWMRKAVEQRPDNDALLDTYANLLYKAGLNKEEAIQWEQKAALATSGWQRDVYTKVIEQMKKGEPTYVHEGAVWD